MYEFYELERSVDNSYENTKLHFEAATHGRVNKGMIKRIKKEKNADERFFSSKIVYYPVFNRVYLKEP